MSDEAEVAKNAVENGPFVLKNLIPTLWMVGVAMIGGFVSFWQKVKTGKARAFNLMELVGELITSAFCGLLTFWICRRYGVDEYATAAGVGIAGHMGARGIFLAEQWAERFVGRWKL